MEAWQVALVVMVAVLVGALLPLLVQVYGTLHTVRTVVEKSAKDVEAAVASIHRVAERADRLGQALEKDGRVGEIVEGLASAAEVMNQMRSTLQVAGTVSAAVVPAVTAAVRAWKGTMHEDPSEGPPEGAAASAGSTHERKEATG